MFLDYKEVDYIYVVDEKFVVMKDYFSGKWILSLESLFFYVRKFFFKILSFILMR